MGTCGIAAGARDVLTEMMAELERKAVTDVTVRQSGCIGLCDQEPMFTVTDRDGKSYLYVNLTRDKVREIVSGHLVAGKPVTPYINEEMRQERREEVRQERRVVVIDADEEVRDQARSFLEPRGYRVRGAGDAPSALRLLEQEGAEVVLVDRRVSFAGAADPWGLLAPRLASRAVLVALSAAATVEAAVESLQHGAFDFLAKPFTADALLRVVERAAEHGKLTGERERYLSELAGERSLCHQMISSMHEGVAVLNIRREPVLMNPRAEHLLGRRFREGMSLPELFPDLDAAAAMEAVMDAAPERPACRVVGLTTADRRLQLSISPLLRDGQPGGAIVILSDVTQTWKAEQDKNRFVSMVAHELKSPLSAIINYINVILTGMFDGNAPKVREMLERCKVRGEALLDLVRDLLYINSREIGKVDRTLEEVDLKTVLASQLDFFRVQAEKRRITTRLEAPPGECRVLADRGDLDRVFMNLISNGIKYNRDQGCLTLRIGNAGASWEIAVADTGIGMSDAEAAGIFQEFYRVKSARTAGIPGTGLGLATVKRVLGEYNGGITVRSRPDAGSTFTLSFPKA
jgi:signal transduction histidine kinase